MAADVDHKVQTLHLHGDEEAAAQLGAGGAGVKQGGGGVGKPTLAQVQVGLHRCLYVLQQEIIGVR